MKLLYIFLFATMLTAQSSYESYSKGKIDMHGGKEYRYDSFESGVHQKNSQNLSNFLSKRLTSKEDEKNRSSTKSLEFEEKKVKN